MGERINLKEEHDNSINLSFLGGLVDLAPYILATFKCKSY